MRAGAFWVAPMACCEVDIRSIHDTREARQAARTLHSVTRLAREAGREPLSTIVGIKSVVFP